VVIWFLVAVLISAASPAARAADPYVVYTANRFVDGAVVLRSDPATGSTLEISRNGAQGNLFQQPYDLAVEADGSLLVADLGQSNQKDGAVIRVDPVSGRQTLVSGGGVGGDLFFDPSGIAVGPGGTIYVLDTLFGSSSGAVIRVNPVTGAQQLVSSNFNPLGLFDYPFGIAVAPNGKIAVVNRTLAGILPINCLLGTGAVFEVDPATGVQSLISAGDRLKYPLGVASDTDGSLVVANECQGADGLVRVPRGAPQVDLASNGDEDVLRTPERVAITPAGDFLVSDFNVGPDGDGGIVKVARGSKAQTLMTADARFNHPLGIAVVRNQPPIAALAIAPSVVAAGRQVSLDASASRDPEGLRLVYEWDLDGNGDFEAGSGTTPAAAPRFANDGFKTVRVRVNDPHGGRAVAERTLRVDGSMPVITGLRVARVLGLRSKRRRPRAAAAPPRATQLRFRLSEAATVTVTLERARAGRRRKGRACNPRAKRGRRCTVYRRARTIRRAGVAGENAIPLRARGLKPGTYRITVRATDAVGNRSAPRRLRMRVVRVAAG
jgi:sugar lactone lactonase YvrE